jgi:excisionase family DNA binding protein
MSRKPVPVDPSERLLTPAEVAGMFRVTPRTVGQWADARLLPFIRTLGGDRRYREATVLALLGLTADDLTRE